MLGSFQLNFILLHIICGFTIAYLGVYVLKRQYLGGIWGAIVISVLGAFSGALLSSIFIGSSMDLLNIGSSVILAFVFLFIYGKASRYHSD
ncbi:hypothetical protein EXM22_06030 [Oceanispirochaeta crateris]|uniref:Uncharacterized protein n=1 Tax=Oceanispirochaeta crateris TaxID=2518645 RepID=A0A5C1QHF8_9SPIO|nr:hypothetical protein [Oceanispirochaeta crateris]QEN07565.1 hypothetical protein EXM22_06030 [Oceanispirochaeta crateris]